MKTPWEFTGYIATEILYWMYRGVMWLKTHEANLPWWSLPFAWVFVAVGYLCDLLYNTVIGSIKFRDWPHEGTYTARLKRYKYDSGIAQWRIVEAIAVCNRLNPYDPSGKHC